MSELPKIQTDYLKAITFGVVFITVSVLVGLGKLDPKYMQSLLLWLIPSPFSQSEEKKQ